MTTEKYSRDVEDTPRHLWQFGVGTPRQSVATAFAIVMLLLGVLTVAPVSADVPTQEEIDASEEKEENGGYDPNPGGEKSGAEEREEEARRERELERQREAARQEEILMNQEVLQADEDERQRTEEYLQGLRDDNPPWTPPERSDTVGGRIGTDAASITVSHLSTPNGEGVKIVANANADFGRAGVIEVNGEYINVDEIIHDAENGVTSRTINGARIEVTRGQEVGGVTGNAGAFVSIEITDDVSENGSSTQTSTDVGGLVSLSIPGATVIGEVGVGVNNESSENTTQDSDNPNLETTTQRQGWSAGLNSSVTLEFDVDLANARGRESHTLSEGGIVIAGSTTSSSVTVDTTTNEVVAQEWSYTDENILTGSQTGGIILTDDAAIIYSGDDDGNLEINVIMPEPEPVYNPFQVVPETRRESQNVVGDTCDYSEAHIHGGWGWDPVNNVSCEPVDDVVAAPVVTAAAPANTCDYSEAHIHGGWGWDPVNNVSCEPVNG